MNTEVLLTSTESVAYTELEATNIVLFHFVFSVSWRVFAFPLIRTSTRVFRLFLFLAVQVGSQTDVVIVFITIILTKFIFCTVADPDLELREEPGSGVACHGPAVPSPRFATVVKIH